MKEILSALIDLVMQFVFGACLMAGIGFGTIKFYQALEKDLAIKLVTGLPRLSNFTKALTK